MALIDHFRRRAIRDYTTAGAFIDEQSLHLARSCVRDYSRLRAGDGVEALFADAAFMQALNKACWEAYPRALIMVGALAEALLRPYAGRDARAVLFGLIGMMLDHFDQRPVPPAIGTVGWRAARADAERSLNELIYLSPKPIEMLVRDHSSFFLAIMPLHPNLAGDDFGALRQQLKLSLLHVQEALSQRANLLALAGELAGRMPKAAPKAAETEVHSSP
jgi:hypothetical protein